jgi:hypothetical protein
LKIGAEEKSSLYELKDLMSHFGGKDQPPILVVEGKESFSFIFYPFFSISGIRFVVYLVIQLTSNCVYQELSLMVIREQDSSRVLGTGDTRHFG